MEDKMVVLTTYKNAMHAHILKGALANVGIPSMLTNELSASVALQGTIDMGVQVLVFEKDLLSAKKVLAVDQGEDKPDEDESVKK